MFTHASILSRRTLVTILAAAMLPPGCASVSIRKVPTPTQYDQWSDQRQERADALEGVRFYMPRPFIRVKEPFIIGADVYLAQAVVSDDATTALITSITPLNERRDGGPLLTPPPEEALRIPLRRIAWRQAGAETSPAESAESAAPDTDSAVDTSMPAAIALPDAPESSGRTTRSVGIDNSAWARTPMEGPFEIVFLPDFEEQYAVTGAGNLGDARVHVDIGQGWSLQGLDARTDNRALNQRIFDLIDTATKMGLAAARAALAAAAPGTMPGTTLLPESIGAESTPPHADSLAATSAAPGTPVVLKITLLRRAAVGLYPLLKPREQRAADAAARGQGVRIDLDAAAPPLYRYIVIDSTPELIVEAVAHP
jgi:hypothetical protein